jgi:putative flavoprotein involved in K+ transport
MRTSDCVVVGAGPAGLATSAAMRARGIEHLVLDRGRVGQTWRTQRWDSFQLNTPGSMNQMLGGQAPGAYARHAEVIERLDVLAAAVPARENCAVTGLTPAGDGYLLRTSAGEIRTRAVVVASGDQNVPSVPVLARGVPDGIAQLHTAGYRNAGQLPAGTVLVVGSGQSGCQITEDLLSAGRRVVLATSPVGRVPAGYRDRDTLAWLVEVGFFDQRPGDLPDPAAMRAAQPIVAAGGRSLSLPALARAGATLAGRVVRITGDEVVFDASAPANVAVGDSFAARVRAMVDEVIARRGIDAPAAQPDDTDEPAELDPPAALDLTAGDISAIIWCTGFTGDFSWLDPGLRGADGKPLRDGVAALAPGLWYVGLWWLTCRKSAIFHGFPHDAATIADGVLAHLRSATS